MKKKLIFGLVSSTILVGVCALAIFIKNKNDNDAYGLDNGEFNDYKDFENDFSLD